jgi:hypothetical protein
MVRGEREAMKLSVLISGLVSCPYCGKKPNPLASQFEELNLNSH